MYVSDHHDVLKDDFELQPWSENEAEPMMKSRMRVNNWRQLFDQEELNMAYKQSIAALKNGTAVGTSIDSNGALNAVSSNKAQGVMSNDNESAIERLGTLPMTS